MKKSLLFIILFILLLTPLHVMSEAGATIHADGASYIINTDGTLTLISLPIQQPDIYVSSEAEGRAVTAVGSHAFFTVQDMAEVSIILPDTVTQVETTAFSALRYGSNQIVILLPDGLTRISEEMFYRLDNLIAIGMPSALTTIEDFAFYRSGLRTVNLPEGLVSIGDSAFKDCLSLLSVSVPDSVTDIHEKAFFQGTLGEQFLTLTVVPGSVAHQFAVDHLIRYTFPEFPQLAADAVMVTSGDYQYALQEDGTVQILWYTGKASDLTIPDMLDGYAVTSIGSRAFGGCSLLRSVTVPATITSIAPWAFKHCYNLASVTLPAEMPLIGEDAFAGCSPTLALLQEQ